MTSRSLRMYLLFAALYVFRSVYHQPVKFIDEHINRISSSEGIPKILHFIYLSQGIPSDHESIPDSIQQTVAEWKAIHPGWQVRIWDNAAVR